MEDPMSGLGVLLLEVDNVVLDKVLKNALSLGASEAEVYITENTSKQFMFNSFLKSSKTSFSSGIGVRVFYGRKMGMSSSTSLSDALKCVENASRIAKASPEDPGWYSLPESFSKGFVDGVYDRETAYISYDAVMDAIKNIVDNVRESKATVSRGYIEVSSGIVKIANSYGGYVERVYTYAYSWIDVLAEEFGRKATGTGHCEARSWFKLNFKFMVDDALRKALDFINAKPIGGGLMPVVFDADVFSRIIDTMLSTSLSADEVQKGRSPYIGKLNSRVAMDSITLIDDGLLSGGFGSREFDDDGIKPQRNIMIENGILKTFLYDNYTAKKDGRESTGNAHRSYHSAPKPAPNNLILKPGDLVLDEILEIVGCGLYVVDTIGEWLSNPISGNLNATVTHAYLIENGRIGKPVKGVTVSGDFGKMLLEDVKAIGKDLKQYRNIYSPTVAVGEAVISGIS
jgi:PmbA protein